MPTSKQFVKQVEKKAAAKVAAKARKKAGRVARNTQQLTALNPKMSSLPMEYTHNQYLNALLDPVNAGYGAKIPDLVTTASFPFQGTWKLDTQTVNAQGIAGFAVSVGALGAGSALTPTAAATSAVLAVTTTQTRPYASMLASNCMSLRIVSAFLCVQYQGAPLNAKGQLSARYTPRVSAGLNFPAQSISEVTNGTYANALPVTKGYIQVIYLPFDPTCCNYVIPTQTGIPYGGLEVYVSGANPGDAVSFTLVENYECLALNANASILAAETSYSDPFEMSITANVVSSSPHIATAVPEAALEQASPELGVQAQTPFAKEHKKPTLMNKILGGAKSVARGAGHALKFASEIAPTLAPLLMML